MTKELKMIIFLRVENDETSNITYSSDGGTKFKKEEFGVKVKTTAMKEWVFYPWCKVVTCKEASSK